MRLLFISNLYPPHDIGGYEQWAYEIAGKFSARGHDVHVLTSDYGAGGRRPPHDSRDGVRRTMRLQSDIHFYRPLRFFTHRKREEQENRLAVERAIRQVQPDRILVWGMWNLTQIVPWQAEQMMPGRVAYFISSYWPQDSGPHRAYWRTPANSRAAKWLKQRLAPLALSQLEKEGCPPKLQFEHVRCCSRYVRSRLVEAGRLPESAGVLYGGIDPEPFRGPRQNREPAAALQLLYFGSLIPQKGVRTAVEAMRILKGRGLDAGVRLTVLGSGHRQYEASLHRAVREYDLSGRVVFRPRVTREQVPAELRSYDAFLFTSVWAEPMARTVMEAMAAGMLVIGSEVGGQMEMLTNGENALTFQPSDAEGLAGHIQAVLEKPALRRTLAAAGRELVLRRFTLERMADDMESWLRSFE